MDFDLTSRECRYLLFPRFNGLNTPPPGNLAVVREGQFGLSKECVLIFVLAHRIGQDGSPQRPRAAAKPQVLRALLTIVAKRPSRRPGLSRIVAVEHARHRRGKTEIVMKVMSHGLRPISALVMMALINLRPSHQWLVILHSRCKIVIAHLLLILALLAMPTWSIAQSSTQVGLPVIFVHGICDTPDSFLPMEQAVRATLESRYPTLYPPPGITSDADEYVVFYDGVNVTFQVPPASQYNPVLSSDQVDRTRRFFLVALDDPGQTIYQFFDAANEVANIPIYQKGNELV